jgi:hypothetical protein
VTNFVFSAKLLPFEKSSSYTWKIFNNYLPSMISLILAYPFLAGAPLWLAVGTMSIYFFLAVRLLKTV